MRGGRGREGLPRDLNKEDLVISGTNKIHQCTSGYWSQAGNINIYSGKVGVSNSSANKNYDIYLPSKNGRFSHHEISKNIQGNFVFFAGQSDYFSV